MVLFRLDGGIADPAVCRIGAPLVHVALGGIRRTHRSGQAREERQALVEIDFVAKQAADIRLCLVLCRRAVVGHVGHVCRVHWHGRIGIGISQACRGIDLIDTQAIDKTPPVVELRRCLGKETELLDGGVRPEIGELRGRHHVHVVESRVAHIVLQVDAIDHRGVLHRRGQHQAATGRIRRGVRLAQHGHAHHDRGFTQAEVVHDVIHFHVVDLGLDVIDPLGTGPVEVAQLVEGG